MAATEAQKAAARAQMAVQAQQVIALEDRQGYVARVISHPDFKPAAFAGAGVIVALFAASRYYKHKQKKPTARRRASR